MLAQGYNRARSMVRRKQLAALLLLLVCAWTLIPHYTFDALLFETEVPLSERIHVVFSASGSYTVGLTALINSTLSTASPTNRQRLHFHIISTDMEEATQVATTLQHHLGSSLISKLSLYGLDALEDSRLESVKVWAGYRAAALSQPIVYARYLVPQFLSEDIKRVIYLDQDVVVQKDITDLWNIDLEGYPVAAARLCRSSALWRKQLKMGKAPLQSYDHDTCTLNNGVLVYDLDQWRASDPSYSDQLFEWTQMNSEDQLYSLGSQPPFNLVFYRNYKILSDHWNLMDVAGLNEETDHGKGMPSTHSAEKVQNAAILHWNGIFKPWSCGGEGYYAGAWQKYFPSFKQYLPSEVLNESEKICNKLVITAPHTPAFVEQLTVVIVAFARLDNLIKIVKHLEHSDYVKEIIIAWNNQDVGCPNELNSFPWVKCIPQSENLVHNRFLVWQHVTTEAVLHYDDDIMVPLADIEAAFNLWRRQRDDIVGFEPRVIACDGDNERLHHSSQLVMHNAGEIPANCNYKFKLTNGYYDVVIGKIFLVHRRYMKAYFDNQALVDLSNDAPCEDIAMSFLVSTLPASQSPHRVEPGRLGYPPALGTNNAKGPVLFASNITEIQSKMFKGLSQGIDTKIWRHKRHQCVQRLVEIFGGERPLGQTSYFTRDPVRERIYKLPVKDNLEQGWCSDIHGSRVCRQP